MGDQGYPGIPGPRGDYSFSGPQGETGAPGKHKTFFFFPTRKSIWFLIRSIFTGRYGDIGPIGYHGLDGQKGMAGENGTTSFGDNGEKGTFLWISFQKHPTLFQSYTSTKYYDTEHSDNFELFRCTQDSKENLDSTENPDNQDEWYGPNCL